MATPIVKARPPGTPGAAPASRLPPGPGAPVLAQTVFFHRDPLGVLTRARSAHGDLFTLHLAIKGAMVVVADPAEAETLLRRDPGSAHAGAARRTVLPMASPRSVFGADDEKYRTAHRRLAGAFEPEAIAEQRDAMADLAKKHALAWPDRRPFRLLPRVRSLIDEVFVRLVLGVRDETRAAELARNIGRMLWTPGNPPMPIPGEGDGAPGAIGAALFKRMQAPVSRLVAEEVESRRGADSGERDVIATILRADPALPADAIADELIAVLAAAQEPPSIAITWLLDRLGRDPDLCGRYLAAEPGGSYRDAVVREVLRLRPPALAGLRKLTGPAQVGDRVLPAGTMTMVPIPLLHRDPRFFAEPEQFRPERWLTHEVDERAYLPFGCGERRCLGEHLARAYFDAIVPAIAGIRRLRPLSREPERMVVRATVLVPQRNALVVPQGR